jgi:hypothetical protein
VACETFGQLLVFATYGIGVLAARKAGTEYIFKAFANCDRHQVNFTCFAPRLSELSGKQFTHD